MRALFDRCYPALVRFLVLRTGDRDEAEEIAQEAFVRLLDERPRRPRAWLYTVALNIVRDARRVGARRTHLLEVFAGGRTATSPPPDRAVLRDERIRKIGAVLEALSERDRTILLLRQEGVSYREIAEIVSVSPSSVGPLLARAQRRFLRAWETQSEEDRDATTSA